jgi:hypothetical protein
MARLPRLDLPGIPQHIVQRGNEVDSERYALACYRYIGLNPVRAGIVTCPREYLWSSHARNAYGTQTAPKSALVRPRSTR